MIQYSYTLGRQEIDIHDYNSVVAINFACARTIDEYDATISIPRICVTSQVYCGDVTMRKRSKSNTTLAKVAIENCFWAGLWVRRGIK